LLRNAEGLEGQPLPRAHCHGGVHSAFLLEMLKNGSRAFLVGTEYVNRERAELETAFPRCVIIHPEQLVYVRLSVEKGRCLGAPSESSRMSGRPHARKSGLRFRVSVKHDATVTSDVAATQSVPAHAHASRGVA
jgi:hypothetical protein